MGVFDQIKSGSSSSSSGGVFGKIKQVEDIQNVASFKHGEQQFGTPFQDPSQSPFMQHVNQNNIDNPPSPHDSTRDIPILGSVFKALDAFGKTPVQHVIADVGQMLYTPGAGLANVAGFTGAAEQGISKLFGAAESTGAKIAQRAGAEAVTGAPLGVGQYQAQGGDNLGEAAKQGVFGALLGGAGGAAGSALSKSFDSLFSRFKPSEAAPIEQAQPILGLPEPRSAQRLRDAQQSSILEPNTSPIYGQGDVQTLGLPEGNYTQPTRLKMSSPDETLSYVMGKIKPEVMQTIEAPARRDLLVQYIQKNMDIPLDEIHNMPMKQLQDLGQNIQQDLHAKMPQIAAQVAAKYGHDLPSLLEGQAPNLRAQIAKDTQSQVYGVPARSVDIQKPSFNVQHVADAAMPETKVKRLSDLRQEVAATKQVETKPLNSTVNKNVTVSPDNRIKGQALRDLKTGDELKFAQTIKASDHTAPELTQKLSEQPVVGARTTDVLNRQQANDLIIKHGTDGLYSKLMSKTKQFSASETTAAQILAKQYSSMGGEENLSKAIDLVSKTAKGGREMGQAIQALSQWNKLDQSGALLLGERQLNRGISDTTEWKKLSTAQAEPIQDAAQRAEVAAQTKSLADEVLHIVTNKPAGEALTEAEKATIKQFNDQVKSINEKTKPFLPQEKEAKGNATIKEVSQIEPKARTRDQVVSFLDAKAEKARQRIAASRQMGFAAVNKGNPVIDYAIIGAAKIAKGAVKLSDFTEQMVKDFGDSVKPYINEAFNKATNIFRKENGLPTVQELDRVVRNAIKNDRFTTEEANHFKAWANEIGFYADKNMKTEAVQDLQAAMKDLGESTLGQKLATLQTGAQLLNAVTVGRNVIGNVALIASEKVNKVAAIPIDWAFSKLTGERTIQWSPKTQEKMITNFLNGTESGWKGVSPTGTLDSYGIHPNVFSKNDPLKYVAKSLGASMQGFDFAAYRIAYGDVLATYGEQLGKAQGLSKAEIRSQMPQLIEKLDQRIHDLADEAGRYATFQDDTILSQGAEMLKRGLNKITDFPMQKMVDKGLLPKKLSTEGFGLGDVVLKYAKTPANLIMRGIDYSPLGFVRATMELAPLLVNSSKFNQFQATRALSRAITGTLGLTGMGYILADAGVLTGSSSMDKDVRSIQEQSGQGAYKVNWSALTRFFTSGFDKTAAKFQKGDHLMDYAWLQPAAISLAMGVNAQKAVTNIKNGADTNGWQAAGKAVLGGIQTVLENPMVQGISSVIDAGSDIVKKQDPTKLINIAKGVPASFVPTLLNQARTTTDNKQRETFDKNVFVEIGNLMANKVPGLSKNLPISYDSLGNEREKIQGGQANSVPQALTAFFSPAKMTEYQVSPEAKLALDIMNQSSDATVLPRIVNKSFHVAQGKQLKDLKVSLNKEQFSQLQQETGKMVTDKLSQKADYLANPNVSLQHKVDTVKKILSEAGQKVRADIGVQMGYQKSKIKS